MEVYVPMILATVLLTWLALHVERKQRIFTVVIAVMIPAIVAMLRYNNGADYLMYLRMMKLAEQSGSLTTSFSSLKSMEIGFWLLLKICGAVWHGKYFLTYGLIALVICGFFYNAIWQQSKNPLLSVFLFFASGIYFDSYNALRQYIAVAIVVFAYVYLFDGKFKKYIITIVAAFLFHYSAVIMIPVYFIRNIKIDLKKACMIAIGVVLGGNLAYKLVTMLLSYTRYKYFITSIEYEAQTQTSAILFTSMISLISYGYIAWKKINVSDTFQRMMSFQILPLCVALLSISVPLIWRVLYYFLPFEIIYIPAFLNEVRKQKIRWGVAAIFIVMYTVVTYWGMSQNEWYNALPYNYYFDYMHSAR